MCPEKRREGCQRKWKARIVRQRTYTLRRTRSNIQKILGFIRAPTFFRQPRETESKLQMWVSNPIPSESRRWSGEECKQSVDLRSTASPRRYLQRQAVHAKNCRTKVQKLSSTNFEKKTCELHEVQRRTEKENVSVSIHTWKWDSKYSMRREAECQKCFLANNKLKELHRKHLHDVPRKRGAKHCAQQRQKHHFEAKEFMRKFTYKGNNTSILDRLQNEDVFHCKPATIFLVRRMCKYSDYVRTIDITHHAPPEQRERYAALYHFRYHPHFGERPCQPREPVQPSSEEWESPTRN